MERKWAIAGVVIVVVLLAVAYGVYIYTLPPSITTVKIGAIEPLSGSGAEYGTRSKQGYVLAMEEINEKGGITVNGRKYKIELILYDTRGLPEDGVAAARRLIVEDKVVAILGATYSSVTMAVVPVIEEYGIPMLNAYSSADVLTNPGTPHFFRSYYPAGLETWTYTMKLQKTLHLKGPVAFIGTNDDAGRAYYAGFEKVFGELGIESSCEYYETGTKDFYSYLTKIQGLGAEAVFFQGTVGDGSCCWKQFCELGMAETHIKLSEATHSSDKALEMCGKEVLEGMHCMWFFDTTNPDPKVRELCEKWKVRWGKEISGAGNDALAYDNMYVLAQAIERANSFDPEKITAALEETDYYGVMGHITFTPWDGWRHQSRLFPGVLVWRDGERVILEPLGPYG